MGELCVVIKIVSEQGERCFWGGHGGVDGGVDGVTGHRRTDGEYLKGFTRIIYTKSFPWWSLV